MLTYQDCLGLCPLSDEEVAAIAEHEHIPQICAVEMGSYLMQGDDGVPVIKRIILDDIAAASAHGDEEHAQKLKLVLWHFLDTHPDNPKNKPA